MAGSRRLCRYRAEISFRRKSLIELDRHRAVILIINS